MAECSELLFSFCSVFHFSLSDLVGRDVSRSIPGSLSFTSPFFFEDLLWIPPDQLLFSWDILAGSRSLIDLLFTRPI